VLFRSSGYSGDIMFNSFRAKLFVVFILTTTLISGFSIYFLYRIGLQEQFYALRNRVVAIAATTTLLIDGQKHREIDPYNPVISEYNRELNAMLYDVKEGNPDVKYVYTLRGTDNPDICLFVGDSEAKGKERWSQKDLDEVSYDVSGIPELTSGEAFIHPVATENFYQDKWGTWITGYAPIKNADGKIRGLVCVDLSLKKVAQYQRSIKIWAIAILLFSIVISFFLSLFISLKITVPLVKITEHTKVISEGEFKKIDIEAKDEIKTLANAFNEMVDKLDNMFLALNHAQEDLKESYRDTIHRLAIAAEHKDKVTHDHLARVSNYSKFIAEEMGLSKDEVEEVYYGSPMHDIGKIGIPDEILLKKGKLTDEEYEIVKKHSEFGYKILKGSESPYLKAAALISHNHHENFDGKGYPRKLKGKEIHIYGRIVAVADVFDALTSERPYKKAFPFEEAVEMIKEKSGSQFDPEVVEAFLRCLPRIEEYVKYVEWRAL